MINVSWEDAKAYASWLSQKTGKRYRLLSEAEWEYCCRAGTTTKHAFGDGAMRHQAQFSEGEMGSAQQTVEVGTFPPNGWGLYDTHANVWEWCEDDWHDNYEGAPQDGTVWQGDGNAPLRILRGGSWASVNPGIRRSAFRYHARPDLRSNFMGFRPSRTL